MNKNINTTYNINELEVSWSSHSYSYRVQLEEDKSINYTLHLDYIGREFKYRILATTHCSKGCIDTVDVAEGLMTMEQYDRLAYTKLSEDRIQFILDHLKAE